MSHEHRAEAVGGSGDALAAPVSHGGAALDLAAVRARLAGQHGRRFWRHLDELAQTPEFAALVESEFPRQAAVWPADVDRRRFLHLMGASLALGGLTACTKQPPEQIVPYVRQPEELIPGRPLYYASALVLDGCARAVLVESHMGRPTKIEGNPEHPASLGATDLFAQAALLGLYDPDRSQVVRHLGRIRSWAAFTTATREALAVLGSAGPVRLRILSGTVTSPALAAQIGRLLAEYPAARWHQWEPAGQHSARAAAVLAFGEPIHTRHDLAAAEVILALDSDLLTQGPASVRCARDFAARRRVRLGTAGAVPTMSRFYAVESAPTATATMADHRLALPPLQIGAFAAALARELGVPEAAGGAAHLPGEAAAFLAAAARDLAAHRGRSAVIAGDCAPAEVHVLAHAMNIHLGSAGTTVLYSDPIEAEPVDQMASLRELVTAMEAGEVDVLVIAGGNPVYDAPADLDVAAALLKVGHRIRLGLYEDETSEYCDWHVPQAHDLESWGDARAYDGTLTLLQPLIEPLYGGKTAGELLGVLAATGEVPAREALESSWVERLGGEAAWRRALHDGFVAGTALPPRPVVLRPGAAGEAVRLAVAATAAAGDIQLALRPDPTVHDGRFANNGWLQECPKPLTKLTWDNAALVAPALAERLGLSTGDVVAIEAGGRSVEAAVWVQPGQPDGAVTLHLGYGRRRTGRVGAGTGFDAYPLRTAAAPWAIGDVALRRTERTYELVSTQLHHNMALETQEAGRRHLVRVGTLEHLVDDPGFVQRASHALPGAPTLYPLFEYDGYAWGMAVDLSACTGCNACVIACQAENNVAIVGKEQVARGREMHWLRIDRYFEGDLDAPRVHHQPILCMHCEQAPCEVVCPVAATVHSSEGLNDMVYNRCVGTRYCSNNCPYKVRRFNFLKFSDTETPVLKLMRNPDVTVRSRGVMEKCTYCVQRINAARIEASRGVRRIRDGEVVTACQQACPSQAIAFGDLNDPASQVALWKAEPSNYGLLEELNTRPRTSYLAKIVNPSPHLGAEPAPADGAEHG